MSKAFLYSNSTGRKKNYAIPKRGFSLNLKDIQRVLPQNILHNPSLLQIFAALQNATRCISVQKAAFKIAIQF